MAFGATLTKCSSTNKIIVKQDIVFTPVKGEYVQYGKNYVYNSKLGVYYEK